MFKSFFNESQPKHVYKHYTVCRVQSAAWTSASYLLHRRKVETYSNWITDTTGKVLPNKFCSICYCWSFLRVIKKSPNWFFQNSKSRMYNSFEKFLLFQAELLYATAFCNFVNITWAIIFVELELFQRFTGRLSLPKNNRLENHGKFGILCHVNSVFMIY